ncbi:MAG: hypothetical protein AAFR77_20975 [Cyanobacteria bacterium J06631_2]
MFCGVVSLGDSRKYLMPMMLLVEMRSLFTESSGLKHMRASPLLPF